MDLPTALDLAVLVRRYKSSGRRLIMLDYDGTLTPIIKDANLAIPIERLINILKALTSDSKNAVWIISGRDSAFLEQHLGHISGLGLSAEHGCFIRMPTSTVWENLAATFDMSFKDVATEIFNAYTQKTPGSRVECKKIGVTWHYREAEDPAGAIEQAKNCEEELNDTLAKNYDVDVMAGKANLEVRPRFINKGEMVTKLIEAYGEGEDKAPDFVFCAGDDTTDEDMFRKLQGSLLDEDGVFTVKVGPGDGQTLARWHVEEPENVIAGLAALDA